MVKVSRHFGHKTRYVTSNSCISFHLVPALLQHLLLTVCILFWSKKHWTRGTLPRKRIVWVSNTDLRAVEVSNACSSNKESIVYVTGLLKVLATRSVLASVVRLKANFIVHP